MPPSVSLLMAIHCHQPVGNFGFVFEEAFRRAYDPFLTGLERHPGIRLSLHYSGSLLDWLIEHQPAFLARLRHLAARGQIELLSGGYYEPILPLIPEADRQGQIALMHETLRRRFGVAARGLWLAERVWEPDLPETLARAGIRYTVVDANQFRSARGVLPGRLQLEDEQGWELLGCYVSEYRGSCVTVFPASKRLRYSMPFQEVGRTIEFLKRLEQPEAVGVTFADDGEKFGLWPKTHAWVYDQGWLERFFSAVERESSWLSTRTFSDYLEHVGPSGCVALPCGSYEEMLEWSGGSFRNFFVKYPEANAMYHKMLEVSRRLQDAGRGEGRGTRARALREATRELYRAQCNCAYWHGVFGGLYLSHLRRAVYHHLIAAETRLEPSRGSARTSRALRDLDGDGKAEVRVRNRVLNLVVDPDDNGILTELDDTRAAVNVVDTLARRRESYHERLKTARPALASADGQSPASIHDLLQTKEEGLEAYLVYDDHRRGGFIDYGLSTMPALQDVVRGTWGEHRVWSAGPWELEADVSPAVVSLCRRLPGGSLRKTFSLIQQAPRLAFRYEVRDLAVPVVAIEMNLSLDDTRWREPSWQETARTVEIRDEALGLRVTMALDRPAAVARFPIQTISESEEGLERTWQGLAVVCVWPTHGSRRWSCGMEWTVETLR